jgi:hypothetical protein
MIAIVVVAGVILGMRAQTPAPAPQQAVVRVIDDSAPGGRKVLATAIVSQR